MFRCESLNRIVHTLIPLRSQRTNRERANQRVASLKKRRIADANEVPQSPGVEDNERLEALHALSALHQTKVFHETPGTITHASEAYAIEIVEHPFNDAWTNDSGNSASTSREQGFRSTRLVREPRAKFLDRVVLAIFTVGDPHTEAFLAALGDRQCVGRIVPLVGQLAVQRIHLDAEAH